MAKIFVNTVPGISLGSGKILRTLQVLLWDFPVYFFANVTINCGCKDISTPSYYMYFGPCTLSTSFLNCTTFLLHFLTVHLLILSPPLTVLWATYPSIARFNCTLSHFPFAQSFNYTLAHFPSTQSFNCILIHFTLVISPLSVFWPVSPFYSFFKLFFG